MEQAKDIQAEIGKALAKKAEREKMCDWNTPYAPAGAEQAAPKPRRQTARQSRASALVNKARHNAIRLTQQNEGE